VRNLTKALTVVSLLAPVSGHSLGIGDIRVRSALNQNLNAEISLMVSPNEDPKSIKVGLAPSERFDAAGVSWSYFLSKVRFKPVVKSNGSVVVKVTSTEALKEPYLNFLLEVSWPKGNLYREFTVLVDPPAEYQAPSYDPLPVTNNDTNYQREELSISRPRAAIRQRSRPRVAVNPAGSFGGQVVARQNDTLWKLAARARGGSGGVSVEQMMMALYENNPNAFFQPNVNALSAGKSLKVPAKSEVQQMTRQAALAEFARHNQAWVNHTDLPAATEETQVAKTDTVDSQLKLVAPTESTVSGSETVTPASEQTADTKAALVGGGTVTDSTKPGQATAVDQAVQSKLEALEKQLATMQQIIELKDKQLAELQNPGEGQQQTPAAAVKPLTENPQQTTPPQPQQKPPVEVAPTPVIDTKPVQQVKPVEPTKPVITKPVVKPAEPIAQDSDSSYAGIIGAIVLALSSILGLMWWRKQKLLEEIDAESMFGNYSIMRNNETTGQFPNTQASAGVAGAVASAATSNEAMIEESSFLNNFKPSDFESFESFNVDHGDIDPVAEADVYLAYGRYQQAEDLMKQAVIDSPDRDECKLKLLEIYQASGNKEAFEGYATELAAGGKNNERDFWDKVIDLSKDISDNTELFAVSSEPAVFSAEAEVLGENVLLSEIVSPQTFSESENLSPKPEIDRLIGASQFESTSDGEESTFASSIYRVPENSPHSSSDGEESTFASSLYSAPVSSRSVVEKSEAIQSKDNGLDFSNTSLDDNDADNVSLDIDFGPYPGSPSENEAKQATSDDKVESFGSALDNTIPSNDEEGTNSLETYEFDFELDDKSQKPSASASVNTVETDAWDPEQTIDFSFDEKIDQAVQKPFETAMLDFNFDVDTSPITASSKPTSENESFAVSDLTDMDEMETKLDLAKAYVDMGDPDSAKDILKQVVEKGTDEQIKTAKLLLDEL
jgi:pilus assembly protein FimV